MVAAGILGVSITPAFGQTATFMLTVNTRYSNGQPLSGLWTTLSLDGQVVATGFSPVQFTLISGRQYTVAVSDYQNIIFERWQDTGRTISIAKDTPFIAVYRTQ